MKTIFDFVKKNKVILSIVLIIVASTTYYFFYYESPEECFSNKVSTWNRQNKPEPPHPTWEEPDKMPMTLLSSDPKIVTSYAKTFLREFKLENMNTKYQTKLYMALGTYMEYCNVK